MFLTNFKGENKGETLQIIQCFITGATAIL